MKKLFPIFSQNSVQIFRGHAISKSAFGVHSCELSGHPSASNTPESHHELIKQSGAQRRSRTSPNLLIKPEEEASSLYFRSCDWSKASTLLCTSAYCSLLMTWKWWRRLCFHQATVSSLWGASCPYTTSRCVRSRPGRFAISSARSWRGTSVWMMVRVSPRGRVSGSQGPRGSSSPQMGTSLWE